MTLVAIVAKAAAETCPAGMAARTKGAVPPTQLKAAG